MTPGEAVDLLNEITGDPYRLLGRLHGGETGAHAVEQAATRERFVLKWERDPESQALRREAVAYTNRLRVEAGWPVPDQRTFTGRGCLLVLQQLLPGAPMDRCTHVLVDHVLDLHDRRLGMAGPQDPSHWPDALIATLGVGGRGYCRHDSLRSYDPRTARLVAAVEEFGRAVDRAELTAHDYVHWDFHPGNLLGESGQP